MSRATHGWDKEAYLCFDNRGSIGDIMLNRYRRTHEIHVALSGKNASEI